MNNRLRVVWAAGLVALLVLLPLRFGRVARAENWNRQDEVEEQFVPGRVLVKFRSGTSSGRVRELVSTHGARDKGEIGATGVRVLQLPEQANENAAMRVFQSMPDVEFAELDRLVAPDEMIPNDPNYGAGEAWGLRKIDAPSAWPVTTGSSSITIAILDTGVDGTHEDLTGKMVPGWNIYSNNSDTSDVHGHGTKVAGTAAASTNNGTGVASVAWGCRLMPVRVADSTGYATYSSMASGLNWAADHGARVANISFSGVSESSTVTTAAKYFQSKGGVVTVSAGNAGTFVSAADNPYVLTVSATDQADAISFFSNTGNNIDLAAPEGALTTIRGGGYSYVGGTSFSAPFVAGVAALVLSVNPALTATQVQDILKQSANDLGAAGRDTSFGWGRVNAAGAVNLAAGNPVPPPPPPGDTTAPTAGFNSPAQNATVSGVVSVDVAASDNVGVASVSLSVDGVVVGTDTAAPYVFSIDTKSRANGACTLTATARDAAGNASSATNVVTVNNVTDSQPPTIAITSPSNGSNISGNVNVTFGATDNVGVVRVELYVDGKLSASSTTPPFAMKLNTRKMSLGAHTLLARAYDAKGNVGVSQSVTTYVK